jgi:hypothetical protein
MQMRGLQRQAFELATSRPDLGVLTADKFTVRLVTAACDVQFSLLLGIGLSITPGSNAFWAVHASSGFSQRDDFWRADSAGCSHNAAGSKLWRM